MQEFTCSHFSGLVCARINVIRPCLYVNDITQPTGSGVSSAYIQLASLKLWFSRHTVQFGFEHSLYRFSC